MVLQYSTAYLLSALLLSLVDETKWLHNNTYIQDCSPLDLID
jgi:hypothetical protein